MARQGAGSQRLRVSAVPIFATHWLLPRLGQFLAAHPRIELKVDATPRLADMEAGLVDVALRYGDGTWAGLSAERIMKLSHTAVAAPALIRRLKIRSASDIARAPLIRVSPFGASWDDWAAGAGIARELVAGKNGLQVDGMGPALRAAAHGLGVALAFTPLVDAELASGTLARIGPGVATRGDIWFVCRPRERGLPAVRALRRWLQQQLPAG